MAMFIHVHKRTRHLDIYDQEILYPGSDIYTLCPWLIFSLVIHKTKDFLSSRITITNISPDRLGKESNLSSHFGITSPSLQHSVMSLAEHLSRLTKWKFANVLSQLLCRGRAREELACCAYILLFTSAILPVCASNSKRCVF